MTPALQKVILNGASRHCLKKGFILVGSKRPVNLEIREKIIQDVNIMLSRQPDLSGFIVEARAAHITLIGLNTPFMHIYDISHRDNFIDRLSKATAILIHVAEQAGYHISAAGVNALVRDGEKQTPALCSDIHQIEIFDDGEMERIYNLFRQFFPELLAISTNSSVYGGTIQKDFSHRMRINPASFLPRYISQFSYSHLDKLRNMMRRDFGIGDLGKMDINPLAGDLNKLSSANSPLLMKLPAATELRFVDAQCSYPFIRAQILLFQAIAMYGRSLARRGKRLPYMQDEIIDENKALSIQSGPGAILKPDPKFQKNKTGKDGTGYSFHDKGSHERVTTSLLMIINGVLLTHLRELGCKYRELSPIVLGAELRRMGRQCFANYAEYQKYLYHVNPGRFVPVFLEQVKLLLVSPQMDAITDYNQRTYGKTAEELRCLWEKKLMPKPRYKGKVKFFDGRRGTGVLQTEQGGKIRFQSRDIEGKNSLYTNQSITYELVQRVGQSQVAHIRPEITKKYEGCIDHYNEKGFGFIKMQGRDDLFFHNSDIVDDRELLKDDIVLFEMVEDKKGFRAIGIKLKKREKKQKTEQKTVLQGQVKWFDPQKKYGYITSENGQDIYVHQKNLKGLTKLEKNQQVTFEVEKNNKGLKAFGVKIINKGKQG